MFAPIWELGIVMELAKCSLHKFIQMRKHIGPLDHIVEQTVGLIRILFALQK